MRSEFPVRQRASARFGRRVAFVGGDVSSKAEQVRSFLAHQPRIADGDPDWASRRRHTLAVRASLREQGRSADGAGGILRDVGDDDGRDRRRDLRVEPWLGLGVRLNDPRVKKAPRPKRVWRTEEMRAFAAAAAQARSWDRDEPTEVETWRLRVARSSPVRRFRSRWSVVRGSTSGGRGGTPLARLHFA